MSVQQNMSIFTYMEFLSDSLTSSCYLHTFRESLTQKKTAVHKFATTVILAKRSDIIL